MLMPNWEQKMNPVILIAAYETFTLVLLLTKNIPVRKKNHIFLKIFMEVQF